MAENNKILHEEIIACKDGRTAFSPFVTVPSGCLFTIFSLPYGIFSCKEFPTPRVGVAIGEFIINLPEVVPLLIGWNYGAELFLKPTLNDFMSKGQEVWKEARSAIEHFIHPATHYDNEVKAAYKKYFVLQSEAKLHMPVKIGDYTDCYSSLEHATNIGTMFRGKGNELNPNWKYLPVAYHGRASSIILSGTPVRRPYGQMKFPSDSEPKFGPTKKLDFEIEMGFIIGKDSNLGWPINMNVADEYIFGIVIVNDWSARDIQSFEYVPLGPFTSKNFATTISSWILPILALDKCRVPNVKQDPEPFKYLQNTKNILPCNYDIVIEASIKPADSDEYTVVSKTNFKWLYWSMRQQLVHHTITGCNVHVGDLIASGTISGTKPDSYGSLLELSWNGSKPINLSNGKQRTFLENGDEVLMRAYCPIGPLHDLYIGVGECRTKIVEPLDINEVLPSSLF